MVEWKKLVDIADILYGYPFESSLFTEEESFIPLIRIRDVKPAKASTFYSGDILDNYIIKKGDILVGMDGEFNLEKWNDRDGLLNQRVLKMSGKFNICYSGYLYHFMGPIFKKIEKETAGGSVKHLSAKVIKTITIPIPSFSEQTRIVGILDTFTASIENLKGQIAERRKQYEHYRDQLLDLEGKEGVEMKLLGKIVKVLRGKRLTKNLLDDNEKYPVYHGGLEPLGRYGQYNREANTVMVINVGASAGTVGFCDKRFWSSDGCFCITHSEMLNSKYLYYYMETKTHYLQSQVRHAGIPTLDNPIVEKILVPLIPLQQQSRIVSILDTFEASIANLEAQLKQREKQYEYYRNKLLTFE